MKQMKRFAALLLTAVLALSLPLSTLAAGTIEVTEGIHAEQVELVHLAGGPQQDAGFGDVWP